MPDMKLQEKMLEFIGKQGEPKEDPVADAHAAAGTGPTEFVVDNDVAGEGPVSHEALAAIEPEAPKPEPKAEPPAGETTKTEPEPEAPKPEAEAPPAEEPDGGTMEFDLPEDGSFYLKAGGKEEKVSGKALADAWRRRKDLDERTATLKAQEAEVTRRAQEANRQAEVLAARKLYDLGIIDLDERGQVRWLVQPPQKGGAPASPAAGQPAPAAAPKVAEIPQIDISKLDPDTVRIMGKEYFDQQNERIRMQNEQIRAINAQVEQTAREQAAWRQRSQEAELATREQRLLGDIRSAVQTSAPHVIANEQAAKAVENTAIDLLAAGDYSIQDAVEAATLIVSRKMGLKPTTTTTAPAGAPSKATTGRRMPPAAGSTGQGSGSPRTEQSERIGKFGTQRSKDILRERLKKYMG